MIHRSDCRFCNDGQGTGRNVLGERNGRWRGPYDSLYSALASAEATGRPVRECRCLRADPSAMRPLRSSKRDVESAPWGLARTLSSFLDLEAYGFILAGFWRLDSQTKGGARCFLHALQRERVAYSFTVDGSVMYLGICESSTTTLSDRMSRYQNLTGAGTNERIVGLINSELTRGKEVCIYALKPAVKPSYHDVDLDCVKGIENPLIQRFDPPWNKRR